MSNAQERPRPPVVPGAGVLVADLPTEARLAFIRKVYSIFGVALAGWMGLTYVFLTQMPLAQVVFTPTAQIASVVIWIAGCLGFGFIRRMGESAATIVLALIVGAAAALTAPQVASAAQANGPGIVLQALALTTAVFGGLTAYVFITKTDFSPWGGALVVGTILMFGIAILSWFFPMEGLMRWYSYGMVLLMSAWVLYDTSNIIHHYEDNMAISAALSIFIDFVVLFWHILSILRGND